SQDARRLENLRVIFEVRPGIRSTLQFGSRIVEARDGMIYLTIGEGDQPADAQDLSVLGGSVIRIRRDGSVPRDNPFVATPGARAEIWSYGHRNPQGAALDLDGNLWLNEHGARGGDEVNSIRRGANYGWPVISYGREYSGAKIGEGTSKPGMEQPDFYWDPSIAPSGLMIYSGKLWPAWRGDFFIGSLKFDYLSRLDPDDGWSEERIAGQATGRVRDVREAPDGSIWFLSDNEGAVFRITPG
ncbi:MAG: PQQ-dependent sugar dehydrogenase, partial [Paracoccaceae bacterium]